MTDLGRRVSQLDADVHAIYGLLATLDGRVSEIAGMQRRQGNRLDSIEANVADIKETQDRVLAILEERQQGS